MGPKEQEAADAAVGECTPEGARGAGQGSSTVAFAEAAVPEQTKPVMRVGEGARVSPSFTSLTQGVGLYIGSRYLCNILWLLVSYHLS